MVDFTAKMDPEKRRLFKRRLKNFEEDNAKFAEMDDHTLGVYLAYYMNNSERPRWLAGENVYDAVLWHSILPEAFRRLTKDPCVDHPEKISQVLFTTVVEARAKEDE